MQVYNAGLIKRGIGNFANAPLLNYFVFSAFGLCFLTGLAGLDFPKDALAIFPFFVLISPRPIVLCF
jgi:hypothetical protein